MDDDKEHAGEHDPQAYQSTVQWIKQQQAIDQPATGTADEPSSPSTAGRFTNNKNAKKLLLRQVKAYLCISRAQQQPLDRLLSHQPTTALYVHGAGASCGVKYDECHAMLSKYGSIVSLVTTGLLPFILVVYSSTTESTACRTSLHHTKHNGRLLYAEYADLSNCTLTHDTSTLLLPNATTGHVPSISGLLLINDFLSSDDERRILDFLRSQPWQQHKMRSVQHYGYAFDYERNDLHHNGHALTHNHADERKEAQLTGSDGSLHMFPPVFHPLIRRLQSLPTHPSIAPHCRHYSCDHPTLFVPDQLTVNRYVCGDGIPAHVDVHSSFTSYVVSVSLCAPIVMDFMVAPLSQHPPAVQSMVLPQRSMLVLSHEARYGCHHAIQPRKTDRVDGRLVQREERISLTFRKRRESGQCECEWTQLCDTASGIRKKEKKHVPYALRAAGVNANTQPAPSQPPTSSSSPSAASDTLSSQHAANAASLSQLSSHAAAVASSIPPVSSTSARITTLQHEMTLLLEAIEQRTHTQHTEWTSATQRWQQHIDKVEAMQAELDRRMKEGDSSSSGEKGGQAKTGSGGSGWVRKVGGVLIGGAVIGYGVYRLWQWTEEQKRRVKRR